MKVKYFDCDEVIESGSLETLADVFVAHAQYADSNQLLFENVMP